MATTLSGPIEAPPIDGMIEVVTPENILVQYRAAGPFRRVLALALDFGLMVVVFWAGSIGLTLVLQLLASIGFPLVDIGGIGMGVFLVFLFFLQWGWFAGQEAMLGGRTVGKMACGLRVLTIDGQPIHWGQAILRTLFQGADLFPPTTGLIVMSSNDKWQRLGDWAAGTMVVKEERQWLMGVAKIDDPRAIQLASYLPPDLELSKTMAKALSTYVERRRFFLPLRRIEIARHLGTPLLRKFGLPVDTSCDLLLCAMYYRTFIADRRDDEKNAAAVALATAVAGAPTWGRPYGSLAYAPANTPGMVVAPTPGIQYLDSSPRPVGPGWPSPPTSYPR